MFNILSKHNYNVPPTNYVFGNLYQIAKDDLGTMLKWMDEYGEDIGDQGGRIMGWYRGPNPAIWTTSPEILKEVFIKDAENFIDRPLLDRSDNIPHLINMRGEDWKRARNCLTPTFSAAKMKKMSGIMGSTIDTMIKLLEESVDNDSGNVDVNDVFQRLTLDTIGQCALAMNVNCQIDREDKFLKMVRAALDRQIDMTVITAACFPLVENIVAWLFQRRGRKWTNKVIIERCRQVLHERMKNPPAVTPVDALQLCIEAAGKNKILSEDEIVAHEFIFILAGYETTAAALLFTSYLLAKNPEVQRKLQEEIDANFSDDKKATYDNVSELQYLDMVLSESMRVYPPIPSHIGRWAAEERTICGKVIPKHVAITSAVWVLHHDPRFWTDPWRFDPQRFAPENRDKIVEMTYMPFGEGPRNCIGRRFALMEAKMALVELMKRFNLDTCDKTPDPLPVRNKGLTLSVIGDKLWLNISRRSK